MLWVSLTSWLDYSGAITHTHTHTHTHTDTHTHTHQFLCKCFFNSLFGGKLKPGHIELCSGNTKANRPCPSPSPNQKEMQ